MYEQKEITEQIIKCAYKVHNILGYGFLEKVYQKALRIELEKSGFAVEYEKPLKVYYKERSVGEYFADLVVNDSIIIEVKAVEEHNRIFEAQLLNYLKATGMTIGLILNFNRSVKVKRMVF